MIFQSAIVIGLHTDACNQYTLLIAELKYNRYGLKPDGTSRATNMTPSGGL